MNLLFMVVGGAESGKGVGYSGRSNGGTDEPFWAQERFGQDSLRRVHAIHQGQLSVCGMIGFDILFY